MINEEIQLKLEEILSLSNVCDMIIEMKQFKKEYKKTDFYKQTKMSLEDLLMFYKKIKPIDFNNIFKEIQKHLSDLNLENIESLLDNFNLSAFDSLKNLGDYKDYKDLLTLIGGLNN